MIFNLDKKINEAIDDAASKSLWLYHINAGSCNGCDIEIVAALTPRYDAERLGCKLTGSPRQADIVLVSGPVTLQSRDRLIRTLAQVPEPYCLVTVGSCPCSGNVFKGSYAVCGPVDKYRHVDVSVAIKKGDSHFGSIRKHAFGYHRSGRLLRRNIYR